ncbi:MAG: GNAT family N-acetyltransferase [Chloroflexi bacterium]|nr:GNAT family N-acetyltransferase [Chloroflexota bacterium]
MTRTADPTPHADYLAWDSAFFDRRIARVRPGHLDRATLSALDAYCRAGRIDCLYFLAAPDDDTTVRLAEANGFHLVDVRVTLDCRLSDTPIIDQAAPDIRPAQPSDLPAITALARVNHRDTRFYADPQFPDARCDDLYAAWIARDFREHTVLVADHASLERPVGYISVAACADRGQIGLLGIDAVVEGRGIGGALIRAALRWCRDQRLATVAVVTQGRNIRAQRAYQKTGFRTAEIGLWYHRWR